MQLQRRWPVLAGTMLLSFVLGSLHAFSVLLAPMEAEFNVSRAAASLTYSLALVALAIAVLLGHRIYARMQPQTFVAVTGAIAAAGCLVAGLSHSITFVWIGYGLLFGGANGLGYGYALQFAGQSLPGRKGFAMGAVTAAYALGAVVFPLPLGFAVAAGGWANAQILLAVCLGVFSATSAVILARSGKTYVRDHGHSEPAPERTRTETASLWLSYCGAVTAGLMVIGHAAGLAETEGAGAMLIIAAPIIVAICNMTGSLLGGTLIDRFDGVAVLALLVATSVAALLVMATAPNLLTTIAGLGCIGFCYGGTIAAYPAYISNRFGATFGTVVYGRVFTAWAVAGLLGPSAAGMLYDHYRSYRLALVFAAIAAASSFVLLKIRKRE